MTRQETTVREPVQRVVTGSDGEPIAVADWLGAGGPLVCVHGLTSSSRVFTGIASELPDVRVVAIDCRGRGESTKKGPFGLEQHAADLISVMDALDIDTATLVGHSMGAFVVTAAASMAPRRANRVVFLDGGFFLPYEADPDELLNVLIGPYMEKFRRTWRDLEEYYAYFEATPLYANGLDDYGRAHFAYDLQGEPGAMRAKIVEKCVGVDWREVLDQPTLARRLEALRSPLLVIRAPGGLSGMGDALIPDAVRDLIISTVGGPTTVVDVPDTNHHTVLCSVAGARATAGAIREFMR
ncbi:MAG: alpha/beta hydrolase [Actinomycetota bacterium]